MCGPAVFQLRFATDQEVNRFQQQRRAATASAWGIEEEELAAIVRSERNEPRLRVEPKQRLRYSEFKSHSLYSLVLPMIVGS